MDEDKKGLYKGGMIILALFCFVTIMDWIITMGLIKELSDSFILAYQKVNKNGIIIRVAYVIFLPSITYMVPSIKSKINKSDRGFYVLMAAILTIVVVIGFNTGIKIYNYIYPIVFIIHIFIVARATSLFKNKLETQNLLDRVSNLEQTEFSYSFETNKGTLTIHNPFQGVLVEGGAGAGKSASLIEPIIYQSILKGYSMALYDFKGSPPTLGLTAYNAMLHCKKNNIPTCEFAMINFTDLEKSVRVNPISPKYITNLLHAKEAADTLMKNLEKAWIEKTDFWASNGIAYMQAIIWRLAKKYPKHCTLPHVISISLENYDVVLDWLMIDEDVEKIIQSFAVAHIKNADSQIAGMVASAQSPIAKLYSDELFWVLSPADEDEFSLDISKKDKPVILSISNNPQLMEALSPVISLVLSTIMNNINQQGKNKCAFIIDELPTVYIKNLDHLPATARSNKVATVLGIQDRTQLVKMYGKKESDTTLANLGNIFVGMTNNLETAKIITQLVGKQEMLKTSYNTSQESVSTGESLQQQDIFQARDIMGQEIGNFTGKIAGGDPPLFSAKFPYFNKDVEFPDFSADIPTYGLDAMKVKTGNLESDRKIFKQLVVANKNRINAECKEILKESRLKVRGGHE